jgi:hypothetical protein
MLSSTFEKIITIRAQVRPELHTTSLGCLDAYFHLVEDLDRGKAEILGSDSQILVLQRRHKVYVFRPDTLVQSDLDLLADLQASCVIYSSSPLPLPKENAFKELAYHLPTVFDPASYPNKKKRHARIKYPFTWLEKQGVEVLASPRDEEEVKQFHDRWVKHKLADPKTFKIMFPHKRYIRCFERWKAGVAGIEYRGWFFYLNDELVSVRIVSIEGEWTYDLANFTNVWSAPSQLSNFCDVYALRDLFHLWGVYNFNCGSVLNKNLRTFKSHFPHEMVTSYSYSKIKKQSEEKTTQSSFM